MLIVFEGIDGSGKSTQYRLLQEYLTTNRIAFKARSFPRYDEPSSALIKLYLSGAFGSDPDSVNPFAAASFYAVDRFASYKTDWKSYYDAGGLIILDRFSGSNAIHQGAKFADSDRRREFFKWLEEYENTLLDLPKPDITIFCRIDPQSAIERVTLRGADKDIHERDFSYIYHCADAADAAAEYFQWTVTDASKSIDAVHEEVLQIVAGRIHQV
ncbi:MAG: thymidylate kinase [Oscillospiraceae bacterium]|jgi:dTMP kinase|nr:thymidylate kinase [Oscillospiraceae bacterium]